MIGAKTTVRDDTPKIRRRQQTGNYKSLRHAGASIRVIASRSVRRRKKPSAPGSPPHTRTGHLKRALRFDVHRDGKSVVIGPVNKYSKTIWHLHEFGGTSRPRRRKLKVRRYRRGEFGPMRKGRIDRKRLASGRVRTYRYADQYQRVRLVSGRQVNRANQIAKQEARRRQDEAMKPRRFEKRPLMGPALQKATPRLPDAWRGSLR
ncbi:MAG: hypothetical protein AAF958_00815 [Planctomycetota bacterium]